MILKILDPDFDLVAEIDVFESFIWTDRFSEYGDFEVYTLVDSVLLAYLLDDYYIRIDDSEHIMIIEDREIDSNVEDGASLVTTGRSLESILERRAILEQTTITGSLQDGIQGLINDAIISPTDTDRQISNFIFKVSTDPLITALTIDTQFVDATLYEAIKAMCEEKKIGFKITLDESKNLVFELYSGEDRSYDQAVNPYVVFSPDFDNLRNSNYYESKRDLRTTAIVVGDGDGSERTRVTVNAPGGAKTGINRRETVINAHDVYSVVDGVTLPVLEYEAQLEQRGLEELSKLGVVTAFEGEIEPRGNYKFGEDYFMGDIVQIENEYGVESKSRVIEIVKSNNTSGVDTIPTFATIDN